MTRTINTSYPGSDSRVVAVAIPVKWLECIFQYILRHRIVWGKGLTYSEEGTRDCTANFTHL